MKSEVTEEAIRLITECNALEDAGFSDKEVEHEITKRVGV